MWCVEFLKLYLIYVQDSVIGVLDSLMWVLYSVLELPTFIDLGHMPVPNCFFQVAFVENSDSIIQTQTVQSFAILWQSPWTILGTVTWSILVFVLPNSFIVKAFWNYLSVASCCIFFPHVSLCSYIVDISQYLCQVEAFCLCLYFWILLCTIFSLQSSSPSLFWTDLFNSSPWSQASPVMCFAGVLFSHHCAPSLQN